MKPSLINRLRNWFKRVYYAAADTGRRNKHWGNTSQNANRPINAEWPTVAARVRDLKRNNPIIKGALRNLGTMILPDPIRVEPNVRYSRADKPVKEVNNALEKLWNDWCADGCDFDAWPSHSKTFNEIVAMSDSLLSCDGECFWIFREVPNEPGLPPLKIEIAERDRLGPLVQFRTNLTDRRPGIVYDEAGRIVAYQFLKRLDSGSQEYETIPASNVLHLMIPDRPQMETGDLALACVLTSVSDLGEFINNELEIKAIMSRIAGVYTGAPTGATEETDAEGNAFKLLDVDKASIWQLPEGVFNELKLDRPGANYQDFVNVSLRFIAVGLGMPFEAVSGDFSQTNYSSGRLSWLQNHPHITSRRDLLINQGIRKAYRRFVRECRLAGIGPSFPMGINAPDAAIYHKPGYRYIDPQKEIEAERMAMEAGIKSPQQVCAEHGQSFYQIIDQTAEAQAYAKSKGVTLTYGSAPAAAPAADAPADTTTDTAPRFVRPVPDSLLPVVANGNGKAHHG